VVPRNYEVQFAGRSGNGQLTGIQLDHVVTFSPCVPSLELALSPMPACIARLLLPASALYVLSPVLAT
jgi:hypothetical protein